MVAWPLTGRIEELKIIAEVLSSEADHAGVAIVGRPGVGKSRLAREAGAIASRRGWTVHSVAGTAAAQAIPLGGFADWIDQLDGQPLNLVGAVISAITTSHGNSPVLVVVDDAHLLDDLSAFVLHQLVRRRAAVVIATVRAGQHAPETVSALWKDAHLRRLDLQPLSRPQCHTLLEAVLGGPSSIETARRLWDLTRGNVLFLREVVRQEMDAGRLSMGADGWCWTGEMTASSMLVDLVDLHMGAAPESVLDVVDLIAIAEPLELGYLVALTDPASIEEAERRELITVSNPSMSGAVRTAHPLYAEARRAQLRQMRAARLRGRLAVAMSSPPSGVGEPDVVRFGLLWLESDLSADPDVFFRAAVAAFLRLDLPLTDRLAEAAVGAGAGIEAQLLHAQSLTRLGRSDEAQRILSSPPAHQDRDFVWVTATMMRAANLLFTDDSAEQSWAVIEDALAEAPEPLVPQLLAFRVAQLAMAARPAEADAIGSPIVPEQLTALPATILACGMVIALGDLGCADAATHVAEEGNRRAAASPQAADQAVALNLVYTDALVLSGCIQDALTLGQRLAQQWADIPRVPHTVATAINGLAALARGDLAESQANLRAAINETESRADNTGLIYLLWIAYTESLARSGEVQGALTAQDQMQGTRHRSYVFMEPARMLATAWVAAARGHTSEAINLASEAAEFSRTNGQYAREVMCLQAAIQFGDHRHTLRLAELADIVGGPRVALATRWAGVLASNDGDALMVVSHDLEQMGDRIAAADAAAHAAGVFQRDGRNGARLTASGRATRIAADCGATTLANKAAASSLPLTSREREIATLVSDGLSNKQIAEALIASPRTVEGHILRACRKLGINGRTELAEVIRQFSVGQ